MFCILVHITFTHCCVCLIQSTPSDELVVTILAIDRGTPPLTASVITTIILSDINDFTPEFTQPTYTATAVSNAPVGTSLIQVEASDQDGADNVITYNILTVENSTNIEFSINAGGVIRNEETFPILQPNEVRIFLNIF